MAEWLLNFGRNSTRRLTAAKTRDRFNTHSGKNNKAAAEFSGEETMSFENLLSHLSASRSARRAALRRHDLTLAACRRQCRSDGRSGTRSPATTKRSHKGVQVDVHYLENEAFKAKLPTMLQSTESAPTSSIAGPAASCEAQIKAGFLQDITADAGRGRTR